MICLYIYATQKLLTSLCWMSSGKEFATSYDDGSIGVWSVKNNREPLNILTPHGTYVLRIYIHNKNNVILLLQ